MREDMFMFLDLKPHKRTASFGGTKKGKITCIVEVGKHSLPTIENVLYVDGLKYNLLSISKFYDNGIHENLYKINLYELNNKKVTSLMSKDDEKGIWHKNVRHINLKHISKLYKKHLVKELLHLDLFEPIRTLSLGGKKYTWVYFLSHKHESYKVFEIFGKRVQNEKKKGIFISTIKSDMDKNFKMLSLRHSVKRMTFSTTSLHREPFNKMGELKGTIELYKR
ncbi:hypothetical protein CR513_42796, partial [Mucuna pruriens]